VDYRLSLRADHKSFTDVAPDFFHPSVECCSPLFTGGTLVTIKREAARQNKCKRQHDDRGRMFRIMLSDYPMIAASWGSGVKVAFPSIGGIYSDTARH
jgi:hypothetical protein